MRLSTITFAVCALALPSSVAAEQPSLEQLLSKASATDIVARWKSVCFDHAGNPNGQKSAVEAQKLTWPYQAMFMGDPDNPICMIVSSMTPDNTQQDLIEAGEASLPADALSEKNEQANGTSYVLSINDKKFRISFGTQKTVGNVVAMAALGEMKVSK